VDRSTEYRHQNLTPDIIGCFYEVYDTLGNGFREIVHNGALAIALTEGGMEPECEPHIEQRSQICANLRYLTLFNQRHLQ
jgi:hypothetical protein